MCALHVSRMPDGQPEIFSSVQGEGVSLGVPSVFVRLAMCNLACGFCDTKYTWDWQHFDKAKEITSLEVALIAERVLALARSGPKNVVLTGGEPMLQQNGLAELAQRLRAEGLRIEVETNGTITPVALADLVDQWNVSPKLASSGNPDLREVPAALTWFAARPNAWFKVVAVSAADLDEIADLARRYAVPPERIVVMPEGTDAPALAERSRQLVTRCQELGFRLGTRLHVILWGARRGV